MSTRTDRREVPHLQKMDGFIIQDVSWVMTHRACGDEMQPDGEEYRHREQDGHTHTYIRIVRALVLCSVCVGFHTTATIRRSRES